MSQIGCTGISALIPLVRIADLRLFDMKQMQRMSGNSHRELL